jgi:hypothetical protein
MLSYMFPCNALLTQAALELLVFLLVYSGEGDIRGVRIQDNLLRKERSIDISRFQVPFRSVELNTVHFMIYSA